MTRISQTELPYDMAPAMTPTISDTRRDLVGLTREELTAALAAAGVPERQRRMRMRQIWSWIYHRGVTSFAAMTDISKDLRQALGRAFPHRPA